MSVNAERHTWTNTLVGVIDTAFALSEEELYFTEMIVQKMLAVLRIPERGEPVALPVAVAQELNGAVFSTLVHSPRASGYFREARAVEPSDTVVTLEAWRQALLGLITAAYPELDPVETVYATQTMDDLLLAIGVPQRAAMYLPDEVVRAHVTGA